MKTLIQKIHIEAHHSFACRTYRTPHFETAWHKHPESELILITEGHGTALIGDYVGEYRQGDIFFLSPDLPHWFRKSDPEDMGSAKVIHFQRGFWGSVFLALPEMQSIRKLLAHKDTGFSLQTELSAEITLLMMQIEHAEGLERMQLLLSCMQKISTSVQTKILTMAFGEHDSREENTAIDIIIAYSFKHFLNPISLREVAGITSMSIPSFCRFFKRNIKKSYFDFIKEIRIGHACKLLRETDKPVLDICYGSGYNSWANFSRQFKNVTRMTPSLYRKQHAKI